MTEAKSYPPFKQVYLYDPVTGAYTGTDSAQLSPLDEPGTYLTPVYSTVIEPPVAGVNQVAVFASGEWSLQPDYRGQTIYNQTDNSTEIVTVIDVLPAGYELTPSLAKQLENAQTAQLAVVTASYNTAIQQPVRYTTKAAVTETFDADSQSINNLANMLAAYGGTQTTPTGFYWVAADNTQVPFVYADLLGLAAVLGNQGWSSFQNLQTKKNAIKAALTIAAVQAIVF
jgi:hypothetical protein